MEPIIWVFSFWLTVGILNFLKEKFKTWTEKNAPCKHGIRGGEAKGLCNKCNAEKRAWEQKYELQKREEKRLAAIRARANELHSNEHRRLTEARLHQLEYLLQISPDEFEVAVVRLFKAMGFDAKKTPASNDRGRDAILTKDGRTDLVQCKRYAVENPVGRPAMQQFLGTIQSEKADGGYFVTTSVFSKGAVEVAKAHGIHLITGKELCKLMLGYFGDVEAATYRAMCITCGGEVVFDLNSGETVRMCSNGHPVNLDFDQKTFRLNLDGTAPMCPQCGKSLRVINGRRGKFFGCSGYPKCRFTKDFFCDENHQANTTRKEPPPAPHAFQQWQQEIIAKYPQIGIVGSPANKAFVAAFDALPPEQRNGRRAMELADSLAVAN